MGGKSKSSSSQSTSAKTANTNQQGNTAPIAMPNIDIKGGKYTQADVDLIVDQSKSYTMTDYGAIEAAGGAVNKSIELSNNALDYYDKINERSLAEVAGANEGVLSFAEQAIGQVKAANDQVLSFIAQEIDSEDSQNYQQLVKWAVVGVAVVAAAQAMKR